MKSVPDAKAALLEMRGVAKSYGERKILDRIDLDVAAREKVAIIGPSGSGKTTILRTAIGLVKPDEGTIRIDGAYLWHEETPGGLKPAGERHARKVRRAVGIVFQQFNLFPHMTAIENVIEALLGPIEAEFDEEEGPGFVAAGERTFLLEGTYRLDKLNEQFGIDLPRDEAETIAGHLMLRFGRIPRKGERWKGRFADFVIEEATPTAIKQVRMIVREAAPRDAGRPADRVTR